jgi:hypothetical protein
MWSVAGRNALTRKYGHIRHHLQEVADLIAHDDSDGCIPMTLEPDFRRRFVAMYR